MFVNKCNFLTFALMISFILPLGAQAEPILYGQAHVSLDYVEQQAVSHTAVSSNGSRLGLKGDEALGETSRAIWRLESGIDVSGERAFFSTRNRYVGLEGAYGQIIAGVHDTPFKKVRSKIALFEDTIADSRIIMGTTSGGNNDFDERARNMVMYTSPRFYGLLTAKLLYSAGHHDDSIHNNGADEQRQELTSFSLHMKKGPIYFALAHELQSTGPAYADDRKAWRLGGWTRFGTNRLGLLWESLDVGDQQLGTHAAWLVNFQRRIGEGLLGMQYALASSASGNDDTGASYISLGYSYHYTPAIQVYGVFSQTDNGANASYGGPAGGHGDRFQVTTWGQRLSAVSVGMKVRF